MKAVGNENIDEPAVAEIVNLIKTCLPEQQPYAKAEHTIFRVPKPLRQANDEGFEPQILSIGPFHHGKEGLKPMEQKKLQYLGDILSRNRKELDDCVKEIMTVEAQARECYSESIGLWRNDFVKMMVVDGCFLVEMFIRIRTKKLEKTLPRFISQEMWLPYFVKHDMLLLENQIPFFILQSIFCFVEEPGSIKDLALHCFDVFPVMPLNGDQKANAKEPYLHLLDLFHHHCLPHQEPDHTNWADSHRLRIYSPPVEDQSARERAVRTSVEEPFLPQERWELCTPREDTISKLERWWTKEQGKDKQMRFEILSAEELQDAGIKFKRKEETPGGFLDIEFHKKGAVMKIPYLFFHDIFQFIFRNLIAYEQCYPKVGTFFTGYALFMDDLINTGKDVGMLRHAGILEHRLTSDEELAQLFNQWSKGIVTFPEDTHLYRERMDINEYYGSPWNSLRAYLTRNYFRNLWAIPSLIGALFGLALTIVQTVTAVKSSF